jgi:hypothetical protein
MCPMKSLDAQEIYRFVDCLAADMRLKGRATSAEQLERVKKFYLLPLTSEFLGEAMLALRSILAEADSLTPELKERAAAYVTEIQNQYFPRCLRGRIVPDTR